MDIKIRNKLVEIKVCVSYVLVIYIYISIINNWRFRVWK